MMSSVRRTNHAVIDVQDVSSYRGRFMLKADGVKVYVFCYSFGYVVTYTDTSLSVISMVCVPTQTPIFEFTTTPMLMDGSLVYIDTLSTNGVVSPISRVFIHKPSTLY